MIKQWRERRWTWDSIRGADVLHTAGWSHFAQFTIAVVNKDPKKSKYSGETMQKRLDRLLLVADPRRPKPC